MLEHSVEFVVGVDSEGVGSFGAAAVVVDSDFTVVAAAGYAIELALRQDQVAALALVPLDRPEVAYHAVTVP